jgi:hypothetical protein
MLKVIIFVYFFISLCGGLSFADSDYKIIVKVNKRIISNYDIKREMEYLSALNPKINSISEEEIQKIAKKSLIREIIKDKETSKYFKNIDQSPDLTSPLNNIYAKLNMASEDEFVSYLTKFGLDLKDVRKKLAIELNWNSMIYQIYKSKIIF